RRAAAGRLPRGLHPGAAGARLGPGAGDGAAGPPRPGPRAPRVRDRPGGGRSPAGRGPSGAAAAAAQGGRRADAHARLPRPLRPRLIPSRLIRPAERAVTAPDAPGSPGGARRASGELGEGAFGLLEPGAPGGEGLLGLLDVLLAAGVPGLGEALLQLLDGGAQLAHGRLGPRAGLRFSPPPLVLLGGAVGLLDLAEPAFEAVALVAGHHARGLPALLDDAQRLPGLAHVPDGQQPLRLGEDLLLLRGVLAELRVTLGEGGVAGLEEGVLGGLEAGPQLLLGVPGGAPGHLPAA